MDDNQAQQEFESGFNDADTAKVVPQPEQKAEEVTKPEETQQAPEYAQITRQEWEELKASKARLEQFEQSSRQTLDKLAGNTGSLKQAVEKLQSQTQRGKPVEITEEDVKDISEEFPELGKLQLKALQKIVGKLQGTGTAANPTDIENAQQQVKQQFDQQQLEQMLNERLNSRTEELHGSIKQQLTQEFEVRSLSKQHPDWQMVVGAPDSNTDFRKWLDTKPDLKAKLSESWDADEIGKVISEYKSAAKKENDRKKRLEAAVEPRGIGGHSPSSNQVDEFEAGYAG